MKNRLFFAARAAIIASILMTPRSFVMLGKDQVKRSRYFWCITLFLLCHAQMHSQLLTKALPGMGTAAQQSQNGPPDQSQEPAPSPATAPSASQSQLPDDPSQQLPQLPVARPEPLPETGSPVRWEALQQTHAGDISTLSGEVVLYYKTYVIHADKIVYHHSSSDLEAEGHLQLEGGPNDTVLTASHAQMNLDHHTATFYDVTGTFGVRHIGKTMVYSTPDPFIFTGRILVQSDEKVYRIVDGSMTSCRIPKPDWQLLSHSIDVVNGKATARNTTFEVLRVPLFYLPFVQRNLDDMGRESGFLLPGGENSSIKGLVLGDEVYWAINRSMDLTVGAQYWSKRGYAPSGNFRYRGTGLNAVTIRWSALLDRGIKESLTAGATPTLVNQGGTDILAYGRKYLSPESRFAGSIEFLSSYIYRLAFDENLAQATSSQVLSDVAYTHAHKGWVPSVNLERYQSFAGSSDADGDPVVSVPELRILHLPSLRFDVLDRPLLPDSKSEVRTFSPLYWGLGSSIGDLDRANPNFHARNVGRLDIYPHIEMPIHLGDWNILPQLALRSTQYSGSQIPDLTGNHFDGVPFVQHNPLNRSDLEASIEIHPPVLERDFDMPGIHRQLRHVIEPEIFYRYVTGINNARNILQFDTADIATNTNEAGYSLTQRFYLRDTQAKPCEATADSPVAANAIPGDVPNGDVPNLDQLGQDVQVEPSIMPKAYAAPNASTCAAKPREWASWQVSQKFFVDSDFGGALIPNRRNVFDTTLDMTGVSYLTSERNIAPVISRLRFEAIDKLRLEWDLDYDPKAGRILSNNIFAGYSVGKTTFGVGHALLNAADENGSSATVIQSQRLQPFLFFGKPTDVGVSVALNASYDLTDNSLQYGGVQAVYNWDCCGLQVGYRRFSLGSLRDEGEWLWGFTLASIGTAGNIHHNSSVFPTPAALRLMY